MNRSVCWSAVLCTFAVHSFAALYGDPPDDRHAWAVHDMNRPRPPVVSPGAAPGQPPSDAIVLFDGTHMDEWVSDKDGSPCPWRLVDGAMEVVKGKGMIRTKRAFGDCQLHIEWRTPATIEGAGQGRGNSGVFLMGTYELQVLDSYENDTYADGQAASIYAENPPLVNASRKPGEWQTYDIVFHQPKWEGGRLVRPGSITVFHNGVLVQDHWLFEGVSTHRRRTQPKEHETKLPLKLQDHGNPVQFRNIWIREIPDYEGDYTTGPYRRPEAIRAKRAETAARVRDDAEKLLAAGRRVEGMRRLWESLIYVADPAVVERCVRMATEYANEVAALAPAAAEKAKGDILGVLGDLEYLVRHEIAPAMSGPHETLRQTADRLGWLKKK
ncbi:MAG: DUF1080 domain-containing protein [Kiritimatiellae bacterium]|nr:DUF1080 domain-containing protein [Kiritimatiellia bacterium]